MNTTKLSAVSESLFAYKLTRYGHYVSRPLGDNYPYDMVVDNGHHMLRVQIKTVAHPRPDGKYSFSVLRNTTKNSKYTKFEVDFFALHCYQENEWFIVPFDKLEGRARVLVSPNEDSVNLPDCFDAWYKFNWDDRITDEE